MVSLYLVRHTGIQFMLYVVCGVFSLCDVCKCVMSGAGKACFTCCNWLTTLACPTAYYVIYCTVLMHCVAGVLLLL